MKNIQVIDGAMNCTYSLFATTEDEFVLLFPNGQDVEFSGDLFDRLGKASCEELLGRIWQRMVDKKRADGIHGTLFYGLDFKKRYYPTKKETDMVARGPLLPGQAG